MVNFNAITPLGFDQISVQLSSDSLAKIPREVINTTRHPLPAARPQPETFLRLMSVIKGNADVATG